MRFAVGIGQIARQLAFRHGIVHKGEGINIRVAVLNFALGIIDRAPVEPRRRTRFKPSHGKAERKQTIRKFVCRGEPVRPRFFHDLPRNRFAVQINARAKDNGAARNDTAIVGFHPRAFSVFR